MKFMKMFLLFMFMSMNFFVSLMTLKYSPYVISYMASKINLSMILCFDSLIFMIMVSMVSTIICYFSEVYMEWYNNSKYLMMMMMFFMSMLAMSSSNSMMNLLIGWDFLGITSIFLIMFYPNLNNLKNSIWTMFFNRLGDCLMIISFIFILSTMNMSYCFSNSKLMLWMMLICIMTKSAQFPLSAWLPMAMSAPTPISAMVHSSTLVTAGLFVLIKLFETYQYSLVLIILMILSMTSFMVGGLLANSEKDFKKIIAFSTMSQISMMMIMMTWNFKMICMTHMFYHALFKSLLFSTTGMSFFTYKMDQNKMSFFMKNYMKSNNLLFFFSIFMMTGFYYSLSFYSKDTLIELNMSEMNSTYMITMIFIGSILTLMYSNKLMNIIKSMKSMKKNFYTKVNSKYFLNYSFMMFFMMILSKFNLNNPILNWMELIMFSILMMLALLMNKKDSKFMGMMSMNHFYSNIFQEILMNFKKILTPLILNSDSFMMKVSEMKLKNNLSNMLNYNYLNLIMLMMVLMI